MQDDLIIDILMRVQRALGIDDADSILAAVEREIRRDWGGDMVYIPQRRNRERDAEIIRLWRNGATTGQLAARFGLSERRIRQIVNTRRRRA